MKKNTKRANGEGSIYFDNKLQTWRAEIQWIDGNGETHRKSWKDKKQASIKAKLNEFKKQLILSGGNFNPNDVTFQEFAEHWVHNILQPTIKPNSYARKLVTLEQQVYPHLGNVPVNCITHSDVQNMVKELTDQGLSYSTVKKAFEAVTGCLRYYRIKTGTAFNPCEGVSLPQNLKKDISDIKYFTEDQWKRICKEATRTHSNGARVYRLGWAYVLLLFTGMRVGELCALTWDDIDFEERSICIKKTAVELTARDENGEKHCLLVTEEGTKSASGIRMIYMTDKAYEALQEIRKITGSDEYLITSSKHRRIRPSRLDTTFHKILDAAGITQSGQTFGVHTLRHTFATMLFNKSCEVKIVSDILGHCDTKVTENTYIHLIQQRKIHAMQAIDKYC